MLFNYQYVNYDIDAFQLYLEHLVKTVWCQAAGDFSVDMLHSDLKAIILEIFNIEESVPTGRVKTDWLYGPIHEIFEIFKTLTEAQRQQVTVWYDNNNDIEALCGADLAKVPVTYHDLHAIHAKLAEILKVFCVSLFENVLHLSQVQKRIGSIDGHWAAFSAVNRQAKCPYCGCTDLMSGYHHNREAYDHFLPKSIYPFNSVNFHNLAPMCHHCNSTYKKTKDPTCKGDGTRRRAFYNYASVKPVIAIKMAIRGLDNSMFVPEKIKLDITCPGREEEVQTWMEVFDIEKRYTAKLCGENDGKGWLVQAVDEAQNYMSPDAYLAQQRRNAARLPLVDANFLKVPFLEACQAANLF